MASHQAFNCKKEKKVGWWLSNVTEISLKFNEISVTFNVVCFAFLSCSCWNSGKENNYRKIFVLSLANLLVL